MYKKNFLKSIFFSLLKVVRKILETGCAEILMYTPDKLLKNLKKNKNNLYNQFDFLSEFLYCFQNALPQSGFGTTTD